MFKVLIATAGIGSRLGNLTTKTNKALISLDKNSKKVIDYIIQSYNPSIPLVISLGYFGKKIKQYLEKSYKDRKMTFVFVEPFKGPGSSLGYSMLAARDYLQCPFI